MQSRLGLPNVKWCEETLCQVVSGTRQYVVKPGLSAGGAAGWMCVAASRRSSIAPHVFAGAACAWRDVALYHLSNFYGQILDFVGMFGLVGWVVGMNPCGQTSSQSGDCCALSCWWW